MACLALWAVKQGQWRGDVLVAVEAGRVFLGAVVQFAYAFHTHAVALQQGGYATDPAYARKLAGVAQSLLRDRFAGPHTVSTAINKGWTAISFRTDTLEFGRATAGASESAGIRHLPNVVAVGGGVNAIPLSLTRATGAISR